MNQFVPSDAQLSQLRLLEARAAFSEAAAIGTKADGHLHCPSLNGMMLGVALAPKGLVGVVKKPAIYGEPAQTRYWITPQGRALVAELAPPIRGLTGTVIVDEFYDPACDAAEQIP